MVSSDWDCVTCYLSFLRLSLLLLLWFFGSYILLLSAFCFAPFYCVVTISCAVVEGVDKEAWTIRQRDAENPAGFLGRVSERKVPRKDLISQFWFDLFICCWSSPSSSLLSFFFCYYCSCL
jgi:hypothetical protein